MKKRKFGIDGALAIGVLLGALQALSSACSNGSEGSDDAGTDADTDTDSDSDSDTDLDGGADGGADLDCDDLVPCEEVDGGNGYWCEGAPEIKCWNMTSFCSAFLCGTHEQACLVACHVSECDELDSDPPIPECI